MHYEINVSKGEKHLFATAERSIKDIDQLQAVYPLISKAFPVSQGFCVTVTQWFRVGRELRSRIIASDDI